MSESRKYNRIILLVCFFTSFLVMMICTKASFLYPLQDWVDDNILFTVGRGILDGKVIYRDLYDQKGPLTYFLYAICGLISRESFIGLYFLESITFGFFLYLSWKTISLFQKKGAIFALPLLAALIASADGFNYGGSVEELSLPFFAYGLYTFLKFYLTGEIAKKEIFLNGIFAGCILWIKFSMLGFHLAWTICVFLAFLARKKVGKAFETAFLILGGMAAMAVPVLLYFGINHSLSYLLDGYFIKNIFGYTVDTQFSFLATLRYIRTGTIHYLKMNLQYTLLIIIGMVYLLFFEKKQKGFNLLARLSLVFLLLVTCAGAFFVEYAFKYYGNVLMPFACLGCIPTIKVIARYFRRDSIRLDFKIFIYTGLLVTSVVLCYFLSLSTYMLGWKREELPQYKFAQKMNEYKTEETITILNYDMFDAGFYLASGTEPNIRYFTSMNFASADLIKGQNDALNDGTCEFVITRNKELEHTMYELIDSATYYYHGYDFQTYYLYQRK